MEKEFVPYELAVKLKALGFDEPCFIYYRRSNENKPAYPNHGVTQNSICGNGITAPTFSQAFRWFREKYGFYVIIQPSINNDFSCVIWTSKAQYHIGIYNTYEEAEIACLEKLIEIVESKIK